MKAIDTEMALLRSTMEEVATLAALYDDLVQQTPRSQNEMVVKRVESKYARDRILKLSFSAEKLIKDLLDQETIR